MSPPPPAIFSPQAPERAGKKRGEGVNPSPLSPRGRPRHPRPSLFYFSYFQLSKVSHENFSPRNLSERIIVLRTCSFSLTLPLPQTAPTDPPLSALSFPQRPPFKVAVFFVTARVAEVAAQLFGAMDAPSRFLTLG